MLNVEEPTDTKRVIKIAWFKVDDQLAFHQKVLMAGNEAMGLWVRAASWSCAQGTDGLIPDAIVDAMANRDFAMRLLMAKLWVEVEGGFQFHDWSEFQPSAAEEREKRSDLQRTRSEAGKKGAKARWQNGKTMASAKASAITNEWQTDGPDPDPLITTNVVITKPSRFEEFYALYPRKAGKQDALKAYTKAAKTIPEQTIIDGVRRMASDPNLPVDKKFIKHPATWINGGCWDDEPFPPRNDSSESQAMKNARSIQQRFHQPNATTEPWLIGGPNGNPERN